MVPSDVDIQKLEERPDSEWERLEMSETHFAWHLEENELDDPYDRITAVVEELWEIAAAYTRAFGSWCDYQLCGFNAQGDLLFADGRRCRLPRPRPEPAAKTPSAPSASEPPSLRELLVDLSALREAHDHLDGRKDDFIGRLTSDRDWSFETAQQAIGSAPSLLEQAGGILKNSIEYQHTIVRQLQDRASGDIEVRARAFTEAERSRRFGMGLELGKYLADTAVSSVIPFANQMAKLLINRGVMVYPEFTTAQQAMAYLYYSLTPGQLFKMFDGNREAAGACMALLDEGAQIRNERLALEHIVDLVLLLRSERFREHAETEEQLAARFLIGRFAMHKMNEFRAETIL